MFLTLLIVNFVDCSNSRSTHLTFEVGYLETRCKVLVNRKVSTTHDIILLYHLLNLAVCSFPPWKTCMESQFEQKLGCGPWAYAEDLASETFSTRFLDDVPVLHFRDSKKIINGDLDPFCDIVQLFLTYDFVRHGWNG